jgi:hypothetical protein
MVTRAKAGQFFPNKKYTMVAATITDLSPVPTTVHKALADPNWRAAMQSEYDALLTKKTWTLVPRPLRANVVTEKWVFKHKCRPDGSFNKYKVRWVVRGFTQRAGVDFGETFTPVIKSGTICTVLTSTANRNWHVNQLDVSNAFLHGNLVEQVFSHQPAGFVDASQPDAVCSLSKSLYGLKQMPRTWFTRFALFTASIGFLPTRSD